MNEIHIRSSLGITAKLTLIAASLYVLEAAAVVSYFERSRSPLAAMVAADESAGRGAGVRGALKSLVDQRLTLSSLREGVRAYHGMIPSDGMLVRKYVANRRAVVR